MKINDEEKFLVERFLTFLLNRDALRMPLSIETPKSVGLSIASIRDYSQEMLQKVDFNGGLHDDISSIQLASRNYQRQLEAQTTNYFNGNELLKARKDMAVFIEKIAQDYGLLNHTVQELVSEMRQDFDKY